jgi:tRNA modification GTPase
MEDTIAAISTPIGEGGIAIIRISGPRSLSIGDKIIVAAGVVPSEAPSHTIHFGKVRANDNALVDEVMFSVMRAPRTYTREDTLEINCHGGIVTARRILDLCLQSGARLSEPGEFTKRAFLNGRMDLTQAEAVMDLIHAQTERAQSAAVEALSGHLSRKIVSIHDQLLHALSHIEAHIDFPEEDIAPETIERIRVTIAAVMEKLECLARTAKQGRILREGVRVAIVGRPNTGKSSLMNVLLGYDRSIVTPIAGTTRDAIEDVANIHGIPVRFTDTAGLRKTRGRVETLGVEKSRKVLTESDIIIYVIDLTKRLIATEIKEIEALDKSKLLITLNKNDLPTNQKTVKTMGRFATISTSTVTGDGIEALRKAIADRVWSGCAGNAVDDVVINNRHAEAIRRTIEALREADREIQSGSFTEIISQQIRMGVDALGEIVGKTTSEDILNRIFSQFCIGK